MLFGSNREEMKRQFIEFFGPEDWEVTRIVLFN